MASIPKNPEEVFESFSVDYRGIYGADLLSIILYGSCARGEYIPGKSDINFMLVLSESGIAALGRALPLVAKWHKRNIATPLFVTKAYIETSLDSFPIEFLNFQTAYRLVHGEDVLKDLTFDRQLLRLQCERELKGKLLQLREHFLETGGRQRQIELLIARSLPTFLSIFQAVILLHGKTPTAEQGLLLAEMAQAVGLNRELFSELLDIKSGRHRLKSAEAVAVMERYIDEVRKLALAVDKIQA